MTEEDAAVSLEEQRALAARMFPARWGAALKVPGKRGSNRRASLRKQAVAAQRMAELRLLGASCATCTGRGRHPDFGMICDAQSDFHGYVKTTPEGLCPDYTGPRAERQP